MPFDIQALFKEGNGYLTPGNLGLSSLDAHEREVVSFENNPLFQVDVPLYDMGEVSKYEATQIDEGLYTLGEADEEEEDVNDEPAYALATRELEM